MSFFAFLGINVLTAVSGNKLTDSLNAGDLNKQPRKVRSKIRNEI